MPDTAELEYHKPTSLRGIATTASFNKQHRFRDLSRNLTPEFLRLGWNRLNKQAASGVDKITAEDYAKHLDDNLKRLSARLKNKSYKAKLVKRKYIPKENGKERPLGIPALEDKIVQSACAMLLNAIYEQDFLAMSYGYRPGRDAKQAVSELTFQLQYGVYGHIVEADIKGFFDNIDHDWLLKMMSLRIDDKAFLQLIAKWLKAGILEPDGMILHPETGTPQGGIVSPILANIYLHYALDLWFEKVVKKHCEGRAIICRYADDWVCAFQYHRDARRFYEVLPSRLKKFNLDVEPSKTQKLRFSRFHPGMERQFVFLGFEFYWFTDRSGKPRMMKRTSRKKLRGALQRITLWIKQFRHLPKRRFFKDLNRRLIGHYNYYGMRGNSRALWRFYETVVERCYKWLNRRSQRKSFTWEKFNLLLKCIGIAKPRITQQRSKLRESCC
jgi:group II intron reverse transcriptase/maturase